MRSPPAPRGPSPGWRRWRALARHTEAWLWTGPIGHFAGGAMDLLAALARYRLARARGRIR